MFLFMLPVALIFLAIVVLVMIERSFSLISEFPNRVLAWIGGRTDLADQGALSQVRMASLGAAGAAGGLGSSVLRRIPGQNMIRRGGSAKAGDQKKESTNI